MKHVTVLLLALCALVGMESAAAKETVTLTFVGPGDGDAYLGFRQAIDEANRQGRFLGYTFVSQRITDGEGAAGVLPEGTSVLFAAVPAKAFASLADRHVDLPVFNLSARDDALRTACRGNTFHSSASTGMLRDAVAQWGQAGNDVGSVQPKVWNTQFRRYAAIQLSNRFQDDQEAAMTDLAYGAWAGTRLYTQVVMEQGTAAPEVMLDALRSDEVKFDGAKGVPMQFRPSGQLNQMILLEQDGKVVGTAPVRGVAAAHELDTLGFNGCEEGSAQ